MTSKNDSSSNKNKTEYSEDTLKLFNSLAAYFCDTYCNAMFKTSVEIYTKDTKIPLLDIYNNLLKAYLKELSQRDKMYKKTVINMKERYEVYITTQYKIPCNITPIEYIDIFVKEFLPDDDFKFLSNEKNALQNKDQIVYNILKQILTGFSILIIREYSDLVLDNTDNRSKRQSEFIGLKEEFVNLLIFEKQKVFIKTIDPNLSNKSHHLQQELLSKLREQINENSNLKNEIGKRNQLIHKLINKIKFQEEENKIMRQQFLKILKTYNISNNDLIKISNMSSNDMSFIKNNNQLLLLDNNENEDDEDEDEEEDILLLLLLLLLPTA
ncbi:MAG: hypothetical protein KIT69_19795 [Propionibacteriaceae bacterium]|nr:hypothetical protein [Propionibacteriaceae bacterium]